MRSTRIQLLLTLLATALAAGLLLHRGLPPGKFVNEAIGHGDVGQVRRYLAWTLPPHVEEVTSGTAIYRLGFTPLHSAIIAENEEMVVLLAARREYLDVRMGGEGVGATPLTAAIFSERKARRLVEILLDAGADPNAPPDFDGGTSLHWAASCGRRDLIELLLARGADVHRLDNDGCTPLHKARGDTAAALLEAGADPTVRDHEGNTPLHSLASFLWCAEESERIAIVTPMEAILRAGLDMNDRNNRGLTPLLSAAIEMPELPQTDEALAILIRLGADINAANTHGDTLLHLLAQAYSPWTPDAEALSLLATAVSLGAKVSARNSEGRTPLHLAAARTNAEMVAALLSHQADVNARDARGRTPLHVAVEGDEDEFVNTLIHAGAEVNARDADGRTPLHLAAEAGQSLYMEPLVKAGADVTLKDNAGWLPMHSAALGGTLAFLELGKGVRPFTEPVLNGAVMNHGSDWDAALATLGASAEDFSSRLAAHVRAHPELARARDCAGWTALHWLAGPMPYPGLVDALVDAGADVNAADPARRLTPLMVAAAKSLTSDETLLSLLRRGARINARARDGRTALHIAVLASFSNRQNVRFLLAHGADVRARDAAGNTPLHVAAKCDVSEYVIEALIAAGAEVNAVNAEGQTPYDLAPHSGGGLFGNPPSAARDALRKHDATSGEYLRGTERGSQ